MKQAKTIPLPDWAKEPGIQTILQTLKGQASEPQIMFVGGCVRNELLGLPVEDIDMATKRKPEEVSEKLQAAGLKVIPTGIDHGTVTAVTGERNVEITTLRKDVETDGRRAVIAFSDHWEEDAQRRDFTMNTLLMDEAGHIYDPVEKGLKDLEKGQVIFVGDPATRIAEDVLRILRFFRFHALYGKGEMDEAALKACREQAGKIPSLSRERITQEFFKIISVDNSVNIMWKMFDNNILDAFSQFLSDKSFLDHVCTFQKRYGLTALPPRILVLAGLDLKNVKAMEELLLFPRVFLKDMQAITHILDLPSLDNEQALKVALYKHGRTATAQALMIELAQDRVLNGYAPKALEVIQSWDIPNFPVSGEDLIKQGYKPGPELGKKLDELEEKWIENGFKL